jgi:hypothetical protein
VSPVAAINQKTILFTIKIKTMNPNTNQTTFSEGQCCTNYCSKSYTVDGQQVVNNYKCGQQQFSASEMWRIRNQKRETIIRTNLS